MPFKSKEQERYLQINEPEIYRDWVEKYGHFKGAEFKEVDDEIVHCSFCSEIIGTEQEVYDEETVEWYNADGETVCPPCYKEWMKEWERDTDMHYTPFYAESFGAEDGYECSNCGSHELRYREYDNPEHNGFFCMNCGQSPCGINEIDNKPCTCDIMEYGQYTWLGERPRTQFPSYIDVEAFKKQEQDKENERIRIVGSKKKLDAIRKAESFSAERDFACADCGEVIIDDDYGVSDEGAILCGGQFGNNCADAESFGAEKTQNKYEEETKRFKKIARKYGFKAYFMGDGGVDLPNQVILEAKNTDEEWTTWFTINLDSGKLRLKGNTDQLNLWFSQTRKDMTPKKLIRFVKEINAFISSVNPTIRVRNLIDPEDYQELKGTPNDAYDDERYFMGAESFGAESCDDLCTQCEWCDTCIDGVCENVEEEWGREWADYDHLCRQCHDKHIEEMQSANAESFNAEGWHTTRIQNLIDNLYNDREIALNKLLKIKNAKLQKLLSSNKLLKDRVGGLSLAQWAEVQAQLKYTPSGRIRTFGAESFRSYKVAPDLSSYTKAELVSSIAGPQGTAAYDEVVYDPIAQSRLSAESIDSFSPARLIILGASIGVALGLYNTRGE